MYLLVTLKLEILKSNPNRFGLGPIAIRFTQSRVPRRIGLRKWIDTDDWINENGIYVREKVIETKLLNDFIVDRLRHAKDVLLEHKILIPFCEILDMHPHKLIKKYQMESLRISAIEKAYHHRKYHTLGKP